MCPALPSLFSQSPLVLVELWLKRWWLQRKHQHPLNSLVACSLTSLLLISIATPLFFTPAEVETDTAQRMLTALQNGEWCLEVEGSAESGPTKMSPPSGSLVTRTN